ncbi:MAG: DUF3144 domain-containing protein [Thiohalomonadales bacterium]
MSNTDKDSEFYTMADAFIGLANQQCKNVDPGKVSATFLYAAARFNTYIVASNSNSAESFVQNKEKSFEYFLTEYRKMLEEHFLDYKDNFGDYIGGEDKTIN